MEQQAQDRIHRLGQYKPIHVTRFVIAGSIEERILKLQVTCWPGEIHTCTQLELGSFAACLDVQSVCCIYAGITHNHYHHDASCLVSVPQRVMAFLLGTVSRVQPGQACLSF